MTASPAVMEAAQAYLQTYAIIAVRRDKRPFGTKWRRIHSPAEVISDLFRPECVAIGFLGGEFNHNLVPLDFDSPEAEEWWCKQCWEADIDPSDFPTVITPGKIRPDGTRHPGRHRYVHDVRGELSNRSGALKALGIDIRGHGHAVLPPSPHPDGGTYQWVPKHSLDDFPEGVPECPAFVYGAIAARKPTPFTAMAGNGHTNASDRDCRYCRGALANERQTVANAQAGNRNQTLNNAALALGHLAHYAASTEGEVRATLEAASEVNGYIADDGRGAFEATFSGAWKDGLAEPREIPDREFQHQRQESRSQQGEPKQGSATGAKGRPKISECSTAQWLNKTAPPIEWVIDGLIPRRMVTLLPAEGGAGKTTLEHAACAAVAAGEQLIGKTVSAGAAAGLFAEDSADVLHGRHERICGEYTIDPATIAPNCFIASYFGHDAVLWRDGAPTQLLAELEADLTIIPGLMLLCIDNAALVYAGEENDRTEVTQFMAALNGLASRLGIGIVLSTHKSKSTDGSPLRAASGSTAWINAARHVLDLQAETADDGPCVTVIKSNCTKPGEKIPLTWVNGVLTPLPSPDAFENRLSESRLTEKIRELVRDGDRRGVPYSSAPQASERYLPAALARKGFKLKEARNVMLTMLDDGILQQTPRTSKRRQGLRVAADHDVEGGDSQ